MWQALPDTNQIIVDSNIRILVDSVAITNSFQLPDTVNVLDVSNYFEHPAFLLSVLTIFLSFITVSIALYAILKPIIDQRVTRRKLKDYALFFARQLIYTFDKKISHVKETAKTIKNIDTTVYVYTVSLTYRASNLLNLPQNELFEIFVSKEANPNYKEDFKHFKELFDSIAYFVNHDDHAQKNYENFLSASRRHEEKFTNNIDAIIRHYDRLRSNADLTKTKPSQDLFLKEFDEILSDWKELENYISHSIIKSNLLIPLQMVAKQNIIDNRALILLELIVNCNNAESQLRDAKEVYSKAFNELAASLKKNRNSLSNAIEYFE